MVSFSSFLAWHIDLKYLEVPSFFPPNIVTLSLLVFKNGNIANIEKNIKILIIKYYSSLTM